MYTREEVAKIIEKTVIMTHDFYKDNLISGKDLYKEVGNHLNNILLTKEPKLDD